MPSAEVLQVVTLVVNGLLTAVVVLGTGILRIQFKHIAEDQKRQDNMLADLISDVSYLKGERVGMARELENLSRTLEHYFKELNKQIEKNEERRDLAFAEFKALLGGGLK